MARPPSHEPTGATRQGLNKPFNWGWVALGGCLGVVIVASPIILMVLGMAIHSIQEDRRNDRTPEASEVVCHEVAPVVVARIEAGLTVPREYLSDVRAVRSADNPEEWYIAAEVQAIGREDYGHIVVWRLRTRGDPRTGDGAPEAPIATVEVPPGGDPRNARDDEAFAEVSSILLYPSNFPHLYNVDVRPDLEDAAKACLAPAAPLCEHALPSVVARLEAGLKVPGTRLRGARVARSDTDPALWVVAADLEGEGRYVGDDDIGVWAYRRSSAAPSGTLAEPEIVAVTGLTAQASHFPRARSVEPHLIMAAVRCAKKAFGRR